QTEPVSSSPPIVSCRRKVSLFLCAIAPPQPGSTLFPYTTLFRSVTNGVVRLLFVIVTAQPPLPAARPMTPRLLPVVTQKLTAPAVGGGVNAVLALYFTETAKYASSAVTKFRRSDFIEAMYDFALVLSNFGI